MIIAYTTDNGIALASLASSSALALEDMIDRTVPGGASFALLEPEDLPADRAYQTAWRLDLSDPDHPQVTIDAAAKEVIDRDIALAGVDAWFQEQIAAGFQTAGGWTLGLTTEDVTLLTGNYVLAKEVAALGGPIPPVIDTDGASHPIAEIAELTAIMLAYGQRRAEISAEYAAKRAAVLGE